jgi:hypothetical protein
MRLSNMQLPLVAPVYSTEACATGQLSSYDAHWSRLLSQTTAKTLHHLATMTSCKQPRSCRPSDLLAFRVLGAGAEGGSAFVGLTTASTVVDPFEESGLSCSPPFAFAYRSPHD